MFTNLRTQTLLNIGVEGEKVAGPVGLGRRQNIHQPPERKPVSVSITLFRRQGSRRANHCGRIKLMARKAIFSLVGSRIARKLSATLFSGLCRERKSRPMAAGPMISRVRRLGSLSEYKRSKVDTISLPRPHAHLDLTHTVLRTGSFHWILPDLLFQFIKKEASLLPHQGVQ